MVPLEIDNFKIRVHLVTLSIFQVVYESLKTKGTSKCRN